MRSQSERSSQKVRVRFGERGPSCDLCCDGMSYWNVCDCIVPPHLSYAQLSLSAHCVNRATTTSAHLPLSPASHCLLSSPSCLHIVSLRALSASLCYHRPIRIMSLALRLRASSVAHRLRPLSFASALRPSSTLSLSSTSSRLTMTRSFASEGSGSHGAINEEGEAIGLTGRQYEVALLGNFPDTPTVQPFGTMKRPAFIYSGLSSRIVGCVGGGNYAHRLQWFQLKEGKKHVCSHCGQVFKLVTDRNFEEVKDLVDPRTREHYDYYKTLDVKGRGAAVATEIEVGPDSKY